MPVWGWSTNSRFAFLRFCDTSKGVSVKPIITPFKITMVPFSDVSRFWTHEMGSRFITSKVTDEGVCCVIAESIQIAFTMPTE